MNSGPELRSLSYQVYGACSLAEAFARYQSRFKRAPEIIVAHPRQAEGTGGLARPAAFCQCSATPGQGPWYFAPSRKDIEEGDRWTP